MAYTYRGNLLLSGQEGATCCCICLSCPPNTATNACKEGGDRFALSPGACFLWGRVAHGRLVEPDHREGTGEVVDVVPELLDLRVLAAAVGESLAVGLDLAGVGGDLGHNKTKYTKRRSCRVSEREDK